MNTIWTNNPYEMGEDERNEMLDIYMENLEYYGEEPKDPDAPEWEALEWWTEGTLEELRGESPRVSGTIVCLASLGLWYGSRSAYKIIGSDAGDIFTMEDSGYWTWKVDDTGQVVATWAHHDGTNCYDYYIVPMEKMEALDLDDGDLDDLLYDGETWDGRKIDPRTLLEPLTGEMLGSIG